MASFVAVIAAKDVDDDDEEEEEDEQLDGVLAKLALLESGGKGGPALVAEQLDFEGLII